MQNVSKVVCFLLLTIAILSCQNKKTSQSKDDSNGKQIVLRLDENDDNPRNSEGDFIALKDGRLLYVYTHFTAGGHDHDPAFLAGRYSDDGGKTWTGEDEIILPGEGHFNIMSVSLLRLPDGKIALFYLRKNSVSDCIPMMRVSANEAKTWSDPIPVITDKKGYFVLVNDRVVQIDNGRLLAPVSLHKTPDTKFNFYGRIWNYYSDDNGLTWSSSEEVPNPQGVRLEEPGVVALNDGRILMFMRTDRGVQYFSYSKDKGETWSPVQPGNFPSPRSPAAIERIPDTGDLLLIWNNKGWPVEAESGRKVLRTPLNSAISKDDGFTWTNIRSIGDNPHVWYNYPSIHFIDHGVILGYNGGYWVSPDKKVIDYTDDEIKLMKTKSYLELARLTLDWIYDDSIKTE